jgi:hypothetical protein
MSTAGQHSTLVVRCLIAHCVVAVESLLFFAFSKFCESGERELERAKTVAPQMQFYLSDVDS